MRASPPAGHAGIDKHERELQRFADGRSRRLRGVTLSFGYTEVSAAVDHVMSTRLHEERAADVQFALAVHAHQYEGGIVALWVYVGSMVPRR